MHRSRTNVVLSRVAAAAVGIALATGVLAMPAEASGQTLARNRPPTQAPYPSAPAFTTPNPASEASATLAPSAIGCNDFDTLGDTVHMSLGDVSGHGWWKNGSCPTTMADVTVKIQAFYTDGVWRTVGTGTKRVYSGGGGGNRATGRVTCRAVGGNFGFRSVVDVDLVGLNDGPGVGITPTMNLPCTL